VSASAPVLAPEVIIPSTEDKAQAARDNSFKNLYKYIFSSFKTCNAQPYCKQREVCQGWIQGSLSKMVSNRTTSLAVSDMDSILSDAFELAVEDVFYAALLLIKNAMSPRGWQSYKEGERIIGDAYLKYLSALPAEKSPAYSQVPAIPLDVDDDAILILLMQQSFPDNEGACPEGTSCYDYNNVITNIHNIIIELRKIKLASSDAVIKKLSSINEEIAKIIKSKEQKCPEEMLRAIESRLSPNIKLQLQKELRPLQALGGGDGNKLTNKERFDRERKGAATELKPINPASEGANQAQKNDILKKMYAAVLSVYNQCQQGTCLDRVQQAFVMIKRTMDPRDPRQVVVDFYLKSIAELINAPVYRGGLLIKIQEPEVWARYKSGIRVKDEYLADLGSWSTALNATADPKKTDKKPKIDKNAVKIDRTAILNIVLQHLIKTENNCQARNAWSVAAKQAFLQVRSKLFSNIPGSVEMAADLDSLFEAMVTDAQKESGLIVASAIRRELPPEEQTKLPEPELKDKAHFDKEMANASKELQHINPAPKIPTDDEEKVKAEGSDLDKIFGAFGKKFGEQMLNKVLAATK
jgi:hypothetical protein